MNLIVIKGRLTRDPDLKQTSNGVSVCSVDIAVDRNYQKDQNNKATDFFSITAWRGTGEFLSKYFKKGQEILVRGEMQSRKYQDKNGNNRTAWDLIADKIEFCGSKETSDDNYYHSASAPDIEAETTASSEQAKIPEIPSAADFEEIPDDDLPF